MVLRLRGNGGGGGGTPISPKSMQKMKEENEQKRIEKAIEQGHTLVRDLISGEEHYYDF